MSEKEKNEIEEVEEERIELIYPQYLGPKVLESLRASHPYEEVAAEPNAFGYPLRPGFSSSCLLLDP